LSLFGRPAAAGKSVRNEVESEKMRSREPRLLSEQRGTADCPLYGLRVSDSDTRRVHPSPCKARRQVELQSGITCRRLIAVAHGAVRNPTPIFHRQIETYRRELLGAPRTCFLQDGRWYRFEVPVHSQLLCVRPEPCPRRSSQKAAWEKHCCPKPVSSLGSLNGGGVSGLSGLRQKDVWPLRMRK
jgi:hypothetical protein